jgi:signal transduction histidine kinase/ActR/RegA family two-component response regulator
MPSAAIAAGLIALAFARAWELRRAQDELQLSRARQLAIESARLLDARIAETHTLLVSIGELLDPGVPTASLDSVLQRIFQRAPVPYANLWIADTAGRALGTARVPMLGRETFSIRDREYFQRALASRRFTVGDVVASRTLPGNPRVLTFAMPVIDRGTERIRAVVGASIHADSLEPVRTVREMPEGTVLSMLDSSGRVVFRSLDTEGWIGRRFNLDSGRVNDFRAREGVGYGKSADGTERLTGFRATERAPWVLYVGIPAKYTLDVVKMQFARDVLIGSLVVLIVLAFGYRSTLRVVAPIESLTADARAIADGDMQRRSSVSSNDELGDLAHAFNQMADTVEERNAALRTSQEQLLHVQKMDALGSFAGGIAHDFNNYLASIVAHAELAEMSLDGNDAARADVHEVLASAARAADLTRQILVFSRKQVIERRALDVNDVVRGIERMLTRLVGQEHVLSIEYADVPAIVEADHGQLEQVVVNLVANARDAMPNGGTITIRVRIVPATLSAPDAAPADAIAADAAGTRWVELSVADHGTGIARDVMERIFDPFFSTKPRGHGTGMGLAIAYSIVEQSSGKLSVSSVMGKGTEFTVRLPASAEAAEERFSCDSLPPIAPGVGRILLVEDDSAVRTSTERVLVQHGYTVVAAESGADALSVLARDDAPFDLLLSDVVMAGMSGSELARAVREVQPDIALLYMSGYADDELLRDTIAAGGGTCIAKPFSMHGLLDAVQTAINLRGASVSA